MSIRKLNLALAALGVMSLAIAGMTSAATPSSSKFTWSTVVNNNDLMPPANEKNFNSYNQPSVNKRGLVVMRARSRGGEGDSGQGGETVGTNANSGNQPVHGIYTRDMSVAHGPIDKILDRKTEVPPPNNAHYPPKNPLLTTFIETPSFPRIDMTSDTVATRGNHQPVWIYGDEGDEMRAGTTGIYTNPFGTLITGASKLGAVPGFEFLAVPGTAPPITFDVFPGAPAVTGGSTLVFKGNYSLDGLGKTGVFYRNLESVDAGGMSNPVLIANNADTRIPGTTRVFGSTSPPSAANGKVVFAGFDNEDNPTLGGIYLAPIKEYDPLSRQPNLRTIVRIGGPVPGEWGSVFNKLGEGVAFDGRYVAFWGAWGRKLRTISLHCPAEGNKDRIAFCLTQCPEPQGCSATVPVSQGIFLHDTKTAKTLVVAKAPKNYSDFLFWNFSGMVPGVGGGEDDNEEETETARWRSSVFVAVSGERTAFKAMSGNRLGIYVSEKPGKQPITVLNDGMDGQQLDPEAPFGSTLTEMGLEREGLRGDWLVVSAKMEVAGGTEEDGMAGIYITRLPGAPQCSPFNPFQWLPKCSSLTGDH